MPLSYIELLSLVVDLRYALNGLLDAVGELDDVARE